MDYVILRTVASEYALHNISQTASYGSLGDRDASRGVFK